MAGLERITCQFHDDDFLVVPPRSTDNLPPHVLGSARWNQNYNRYYVPRSFTSNNKTQPVEFLNNRWYTLYPDSTQHGVFLTNANSVISLVNTLGLGYWDPTDPAHPDFQPTAAIDADPPSPSQNQSTLPSTSPHSVTHQTSLVLPPATGHVIPVPTTVPTTAPTTAQTTAPMSTGTGTTAPPPNGALRGTPPTIFTGDRQKADTFWSEFRRYKLNNRNHPAMTLPFDCVLMALSYIRGPLVDDWVDAQETHLTTRTDTTQTPHVPETDPVLWTEFATAFKDAWKDTSKKQNAHDQLRKLVMKGWDIDTYIVTFERLALAANWALPAEGTIMQFRQGLNRMIHSRTLDRDKIPDTYDEWKAAARTEVARVKEKYSQGLIGPRQNTQPHPPRDYTSQNRLPQTSSNSQHVPMEVDTATTQFKKLTPEERSQLAKEGRCFRCRLQGHMARDCPKNAQPAKAREATTPSTPEAETPDTADTTPPVTPPTTPPKDKKLTRAQKIRALEAEMEEEERAQYLDDRDMGEDFWSAGA